MSPEFTRVNPESTRVNPESTRVNLESSWYTRAKSNSPTNGFCNRLLERVKNLFVGR